ncbi:MAG: DinB family protein [Candidatus Promineifilaceae bacterium]|nr:DinB family protein [Candidatus Promineifilaceae bacterium]
MDADAFRHLYGYHFSENRKLWESALALSEAQFTQPVGYSHGSVRDQLMHLMSVDDAWFGDLRQDENLAPLDPAGFADREAMRAHWDGVEQRMRDYLERLRDDMLFEKPLTGEDENLYLWQILLHVVNHGTDHRAQILRLLNDMGLQTEYQDYVFYAYANP